MPGVRHWRCVQKVLDAGIVKSEPLVNAVESPRHRELMCSILHIECRHGGAYCWCSRCRLHPCFPAASFPGEWTPLCSNKGGTNEDIHIHKGIKWDSYDERNFLPSSKTKMNRMTCKKYWIMKLIISKTSHSLSLQIFLREMAENFNGILLTYSMSLGCHTTISQPSISPTLALFSWDAIIKLVMLVL